MNLEELARGPEHECPYLDAQMNRYCVLNGDVCLVKDPEQCVYRVKYEMFYNDDDLEQS